MEYILNEKTMTTCMIGTWAWGSGSNGGKMIFGQSYDRQQLTETFQAAYAAGFTFWDTAEVYGMGTSEQLLGSLIKDKPVTLSTKHFPNKTYKPGECRAALEASLKRLGVDCLDLYWLHSPLNLKENMKELAECQQAGLVKAIGLSNGSAAQIALADEVLRQNACRLAAVQNHYSLLAMEREDEALQYCHDNGILFFGYMILEQGALSGHYDAKHHFKKLSMRGLAFGKGKFKKIQPLIDCIRELAARYGVDSSQIPIAWAVAKGVIPIVGLTKPAHASSLNDGLTLTLSSDETAKLEALALASGVTCKGIWE
ncbi:MAG: aldo/keto reductase [Clostridia bacterium]|nr:aldo/keto reductase [Clostridia bacterium]